MHVKFSQCVAIDIKHVPQDQWGRLIRVPAVSVPNIPKGSAELVRDSEWQVRVGVMIELPEPMASAFISTGAAVAVPAEEVPVVRWTEDFDECQHVAVRHSKPS